MYIRLMGLEGGTDVKKNVSPHWNSKPGPSNAYQVNIPTEQYTGADKSLTQTTFRCILVDGKKISFDASLFVYI